MNAMIIGAAVSALLPTAAMAQGAADLEKARAVLTAPPMEETRLTPESVEMLKQELLFQRASQTYLWALPLINTLGMKVGSEEKFGAGYNVLPIWKQRLDAKTLVTTPNSDVIYAMSYVDLGKDGPFVFDPRRGCRASSSTSGSGPSRARSSAARTTWATSASSAPTGKGGKFLLIPPGYQVRSPRVFSLSVADQQRVHLPPGFLSGRQPTSEPA